jgi:methylmalonyl-CoA/ethylmalonyl-CoA epimerase
LQREEAAAVFQRIDHVGVAVPDLDAAVAWYEQTLGMRCLHREVNQEQGVREAMMACEPAAGGGLAGPGGLVQLLAPVSPESAVARFLDRQGPGLHHVAYAVDDVEAESARLRGLGLRLLYESARKGTAGSRINFVHPKDAGGVLVELVERPSPAEGRA